MNLFIHNNSIIVIMKRIEETNEPKNISRGSNFSIVANPSKVFGGNGPSKHIFSGIIAIYSFALRFSATMKATVCSQI